jgi:hypothetical protein
MLLPGLVVGGSVRGDRMTTTGAPPAPARALPGAGSDAPGADRVPAGDRPRSSSRRRASLLAGGAYLALAVGLWSHVWTSHPASTTTCGCGDSSLFTWFLAWPATALAHGLNPFFSTAMGYPHGVNLLANTSVPAFGLLLAPVTWLFGPIVTLDVALTLAPALSALAMFFLLRRWVRWAPAAFVGGLLYGFSPFVLVSLADAHLMLGMAFVPPLVAASLDEVLFRQRVRPISAGLVLGLLVTLQFFVGTEVLVMMLVLGALWLIGMVAVAALAWPEAVRRRVRYASVALGAGAVTAGVLLAYPVWFALAGPGHLSGLVWPGLHVARAGTSLRDYVVPLPAISTGFFGPAMSRVIGGAQGPVLSSQYLGFGTLAVVLGGLVVWRRDRRLWAFTGVLAISVVLSLGVRYGPASPWELVAHLPLLDNISPSRFALFTELATAALVALVAEHVHDAVRAWSAARDPAGAGGAARRAPAVLAGLAVAAAAVAPPAAYLASSVPITTRPLYVPTWFRSVGPHLGSRQVVLVLPAPFGVTQTAMTWQAVDRMGFSMAGQGGPGGVVERAGAARAGQREIVATSFYFGDGSVTPQGVDAVRTALAAWHVTTIVVPDQPELPAYERIRSVTEAATLVTAATGEPPGLESDAWVWSGVRRALVTRHPVSPAVARCTTGLSFRGAHPVRAASACALASIAPPPKAASPPPVPAAAVDPGTLPQTATLPTATTAAFLARMGALWRGVTTGTPGEALPAFFPESAYVQLKQIGDPQGDFSGRLEVDYDADVAAAHQLLGAAAPSARLLGVDVDEAYAHWVPPGVCDNGTGYFEVPNSRVVYSIDGQVRSLGIASMISWRGEWYVVHFGAVLRPGAGGTVDAPQEGPGTPTYSSTC